MSRKRLYFILPALLLSVLSLDFFFLLPRLREQRALLEKKRAGWALLEYRLSKQARDYPGKSAVIVKDLKTNWTIAVNKEELFPAASLVKIPIMAAVFKAAESGRINLEDRLKLKASDKVAGSGKLKNMAPGREFSIEELLERMIISSDNTATNMLIELLGFNYLNSSFKGFGLKNTRLCRKMMEFQDRKNGVENYTTAEDISSLLEKIYRGKLCNSFVSRQCLALLKRQKARDRIPARLPADVVVAHKTGLERKVCHDAGIVYARQGDFLLCVLTSGVSDSRISKKFISNIAFMVYNYYS